MNISDGELFFEHLKHHIEQEKDLISQELPLLREIQDSRERVHGFALRLSDANIHQQNDIAREERLIEKR